MLLLLFATTTMLLSLLLLPSWIAAFDLFHRDRIGSGSYHARGTVGNDMHGTITVIIIIIILIRTMVGFVLFLLIVAAVIEIFGNGSQDGHDGRRWSWWCR